MNWYELTNADQIDSPAILIYKDRVTDNIALVKTMIDDVQRLRPHVKTNKIAEVVQLMLDAGIQNYKCATIAEAEMLGMVAAKDVLLAYQPVGPKIVRLLELVQKYLHTTFSCIVDNHQAAAAISVAFAAQQRRLPVYLDLNVGMNRTGIKPGKTALELYQYLHTLPGISPVGLHAYDGHLHDTEMTIRKERCDEAYAPVIMLSQEIVDSGLPQPLIVAGGSPTFPVHAKRKDIQCSPGTFVFWDWGYANNLPEQTFKWAALVISRVVSVIDEYHICLDLGHKSVAAENPQPRVSFLNAPDAEPVSQSEEHLVLKVEDTEAYPVGTVLYGVPLHICPTIALYEKAYVVENNSVVANWRVIARDRQIII
ncbi:D-serine deaminase-like pyridoxal phosphate-dependent protein [Chitinophaga niastensis]|uniref:D-serine deaminase-like pyridoxal phosphate-dependent protein n=1 Tax=Chitinophaga niastensis TaxID=536980 RepID=A0A2P8HV37_CHINA|nr:D-TA family PLP-dependent enzyme [Chitinophaga niastensis]PSL50091.1 D-serine deaminase-like pyridoxal phosphate-dependent protein [Chitinophaga niastensis]